jgi:hypothetical protein
MSELAISAALETRLAAITPAIQTAWENVEFTPIGGANYQQAFVLFAKPENPTFGDDFYRQRGFLQVALRYNLNQGKQAAYQRAELVRTWFNRGLTLTAYGFDVTVEETPQVVGGQVEDDRFVVIVKVPFYCNIGVVASGASPSTPITASSTSSVITRIAGENIGALKAIRVDSAGLCWLADKDDANASDVIGISKTSAILGANLDIAVAGELVDSGWNWATGEVWLGNNGTLTQVVPTSGLLVQMATVVSSTSIVIDPDVIVLLG